MRQFITAKHVDSAGKEMKLIELVECGVAVYTISVLIWIICLLLGILK